jgi:hypothetical protein
MSDIAEERRRILHHLDASRRYLETSTPIEIARELMVQALDIVDPGLRRALFNTAIEELNDESSHPLS